MKKTASGQKTIVGKIHPDVLSFTVGKDPVLDLDLAVWDCLGTAAHVTMLSRMRVKPAILGTEERNRVVAALVDVIREAQSGDFTITEADQDVHLAVERRLTERLGDLGRKVHTGRSRNDQVAVDIRLHARDQLLGLTEEVAALAEGLVKFGRHHAKVPMVGRTHLQPAMPSSVGLWATAYAETLLDDLVMVGASYTYNDRCPLGSAAGYGVPLPVDRELTASLLGFSGPHHNVFHASNARGKNEAMILAACGQDAEPVALGRGPDSFLHARVRLLRAACGAVHGQQHHAAEIQPRCAGADPRENGGRAGIRHGGEHDSQGAAGRVQPRSAGDQRALHGRPAGDARVAADHGADDGVAGRAAGTVARGVLGGRVCDGSGA